MQIGGASSTLAGLNRMLGRSGRIQALPIPSNLVNPESNTVGPVHVGAVKHAGKLWRAWVTCFYNSTNHIWVKLVSSVGWAVRCFLLACMYTVGPFRQALLGYKAPRGVCVIQKKKSSVTK